MLKTTDKKTDLNSNCISILTDMKLSEYIKITKNAFEKEGNIDGQRGVISKSSSASKIRDRMFKDFVNGAIFPPVVIGVLLSEEEFNKIEKLEKKENDLFFIEILKKYKDENISIIDGMQRSNVYRNNINGNEDRIIRVEYWVATNISSLLYRMLVLNTGQVPWNVRRQVEVVYKPLLITIEKKLFEKYPDLQGIISFFDINSNGKRTNAGEYHKNQVVELFLAYNLRTEKVDVPTQLAEDFQKLDMLEALENEDLIEIFVEIFGELSVLDLALGQVEDNLTFIDGKFMDGKSLFSSHPARIGFIVAATHLIVGKIGRDKSSKQREKAMRLFKQNSESVAKKILEFKEDNNAIKDFLAFDYLNELINTLPKSKVGDAERNGFKNVFTELFQEEDEVTNLEPYWRQI